MADLLGARTTFDPGGGRSGQLVSLRELERRGFGPISRLPVSLRIVLEALARHADGHRVTEADVRALARWSPVGPRTRELPLVVARVLLQDFTGVPLLVDLAAMRAAASRSSRLVKDSSLPWWTVALPNPDGRASSSRYQAPS